MFEAEDTRSRRKVAIKVAADGVAEAVHAIGIVHRDIKPGNVLVGRNPAPIRTLAPQRPAALERIIHKLLAKRASQRYQSAAALRHALQTIRSGAPRVASRSRTSARLGTGGSHGRIKSREPLCAAGHM